VTGSGPDRSHESDAELEIIPGMGLRVDGRRLHVFNEADPAEYARYLESQRALRAAIPERLAEIIRELKDRLARVPTLQLLAMSALRYTGDPAHVKEPDVPPYLRLEYLTWLCLTTLEAPVPPEVLMPSAEEIDQLVDQAVNLAYWRAMTDHLRNDLDEPTALETLQFHTRTRSLAVRYPGYTVHLVEQLRGLFAAFDRTLETAVGFGVEDAISLALALEKLVDDQLQDYVGRARAAQARWQGMADGSLVPSDVTPEELEVVRSAVAAWGIENAADVLASNWSASVAPMVYLADASSLATGAEVDVGVARSFLAAFSLGFGQAPIADGEPAAYEPQQSRPLLAVDGQYWFAHMPGHVVWALRDSFEAVLLASGQESYQGARARYLEERVADLLAGTSVHARRYTGLVYEIDGETFELDGLVLIDDVVFLIEAKAGRVSGAMRRGAPRRLEETLAELVGEAHRQASRALGFIRSRDVASFDSRQGPVSVRASEIREFPVVTGSLDDLSAFVMDRASLVGLGTVPADADVWPVCELDLRVITDLVEGAGQLINYLTRRKELVRGAFSAFDELDLFGRYLAEGLRMDRAPRWHHRDRHHVVHGAVR